MSHIWRTMWALALLGCWLACRPSSMDLDSAVTTPGSFITLRDDLGREVKIPQPVRRIISLAPASTETLFAIGAAEQVVAVTSFDNYPPEAAEREKVGGFTRETMSLEKIIALKPDLILSSGSMQRDLIPDLERLGLVVFAIEPASYDDVIRAIELTGKITGHSAEADAVARELRTAADEVARVVAEIPLAERPRVFYQVWNQPLRSAGKQSFLGQLIEAAGGQNIFADINDAYPLVSEESVIQRNPQIILAAAHGAPDISSIADRPAWSTIAAVREKRIFFLDEDVISRPGPRIGLALRMLAETLYPARFEQVSERQP